MARLSFDLRAALGDAFRALRHKAIAAWRLYPYPLDVFEESYGYSKDYPLVQNTQISFGNLLLTSSPPGFVMILR